MTTFITALVEAEVDGDRLTSGRDRLFFVILCVAGNETTRNLIAHAMNALIQHPDSYAPTWRPTSMTTGLWRSATEEFLRWGASIHNFRRTATRDTELARPADRRGARRW